jgi:hypothetical protein
MSPLVGIAALVSYGLLLGAVGFFFIALERRHKRKERATREAGHGEAHA